MKDKIQKKKRLFFAVVCLFMASVLWTPESVNAGVFDNAYSFYASYGSEMAFQKGPNMEGEIYYATKAKKAVSGTVYTTIGWKVTVLDSSGTIVDTIYYKLGGDNMFSVDIEEKDGYEYCLYKVSLANIKSRMNDAAKNALLSANANILFDACTTIKLEDEVQGGMTDDGPEWGSVYTTYDGIAGAQDWSSTTKETLKTYYNKTVKGLFYHLSLSAGSGIGRVSGGGNYCFGTTVTITAKPMEGYHFSNWAGSLESAEQTMSFTIYEETELEAVGEINHYKILFDANGGKGEITPIDAVYTDTIELPFDGFVLDDSCICGWSKDKNTKKPEYVKSQPIKISNLVKKLGLQYTDNATITLYAIWDHAPVIEGSEIFVSLEDAQNGVITEEWLSNYVSAKDEEDGAIPYGENTTNSFLMTNYQNTDFTEFKKEGYVTETLCAIDSAGNQTKKIITVHIVDTTVYDADLFMGEVRFISEKYYKDKNGEFVSEVMGGLKDHSVWRMNAAYRSVLDALFRF